MRVSAFQVEINRFWLRCRSAGNPHAQVVFRKICFREIGVVEMLKLNRIGNKLGLAGAVGVLLAAGMVANQMITETRIEQASDRASRSQRVADNSLSAHIDLRKIQLAARDVRLARTSAEVDKTIADLQRFKASKAKELEAALSAAHGQDTRERCRR
jgi:hypothetical protein